MHNDPTPTPFLSDSVVLTDDEFPVNILRVSAGPLENNHRARLLFIVTVAVMAAGVVVFQLIRRDESEDERANRKHSAAIADAGTAKAGNPAASPRKPTGTDEIRARREELERRRKELYDSVVEAGRKASPRAAELLKYRDQCREQVEKGKAVEQKATDVLAELQSITKEYAVRRVIEGAASAIAEVEEFVSPELSKNRPADKQVSPQMVLIATAAQLPKELIVEGEPLPLEMEAFGNAVEERALKFVAEKGLPAELLQIYVWRQVAKDLESAVFMSAPKETAPTVEEWRRLAFELDDLNHAPGSR